jgi:hypothetical protein
MTTPAGLERRRAGIYLWVRYGGVPVAKGRPPALPAAPRANAGWRAALSDRSTGDPDRHLGAMPYVDMPAHSETPRVHLRAT